MRLAFQIIIDFYLASLLIFTLNHISNLQNKYNTEEFSLEQLRSEWAMGFDEKDA